MGTYTLQNFRSELLFDLKNRSDTSGTDGFSVTRQDSFINAGYLHVTHPSVFRHREMQLAYTIPLVTSQQAYTFSPTQTTSFTITGIRYVSHVAAATDDPLSRRIKLYAKDEQWFQSRTLTTGGPPRNYCVRGNSILLDPVPGANESGEVLVVGAWREPTLLIAGAQTVLSTRFDEIVLLAARWRAELHLGYRQLAEATKVDFTSLLNEYQSFEQLHGEDWDWQVEVRNESHMERA